MSVISQALCNFEIEPLVHPFGFKGGALNHLWQSCVYLRTDDGIEVDGLGCENTLWSDKDVFSSVSPAASSAMMYLITEFAAKQLIGLNFTIQGCNRENFPLNPCLCKGGDRFGGCTYYIRFKCSGTR